MTECRKCGMEIEQTGRDGRWTDDPNSTVGDICVDGNLHEPDDG